MAACQGRPLPVRIKFASVSGYTCRIYPFPPETFFLSRQKIKHSPAHYSKSAECFTGNCKHKDHNNIFWEKLFAVLLLITQIWYTVYLKERTRKQQTIKTTLNIFIIHSNLAILHVYAWAWNFFIWWYRFPILLEVGRHRSNLLPVKIHPKINHKTCVILPK